MKRRAFLKTMSASGTAIFVPSSLTLQSLVNTAHAAPVNYDAANVDLNQLTAQFPTLERLPQVINIFLYGGPSELSGNLSVIGDIAAASQSSYENAIPGITRLQNDNNGLITPRAFWSGAGGDVMEFLVENNYMSVYRTMFKRIIDTRSHRQSIFQNQKGSTDTDVTPGIGTRMAVVMDRFRAAFDGHPLLDHPDPGIGNNRLLSELILPFVSFEGDTTFFQTDPDAVVPVGLRFNTLDNDFDNPYLRDNDGNGTELEALANLVQSPAAQARFQRVTDAFTSRANLENRIQALSDASNQTLPTVTEVADQADDVDGANVLQYPNTGFADRLRAAVTLAVENPDSLFITVSGSNGLGGWDDHNNGADRYPDRMQNLFEALRAAVKHIKYSGTQTAGVTQTPGMLARRTDNIMINVIGDFGRRCNLNGSIGWDHGNCQNLFTLGGEAMRPAGALGKVVGTTQRVGTVGTNNQVQDPTSTSYDFEPMALASTIYSGVGITNPEVLTADPDMDPGGQGPIDQTVPNDQPLLF